MCAYLEATLTRISGQSVVELDAEFVQDMTGKLWLQILHAYVLEGSSGSHKRTKAVDFKSMRSAQALDGADPTKASLVDETALLRSSSGSGKQRTRLLPLSNTPSHPLSVFGSSQLEGCPGDFCKFDVSYIQDTSSFAAGNKGGSNREKKLSKPDSDVAKFDDNGNRQLVEELKGRGTLRRKFMDIQFSASLKALSGAMALSLVPAKRSISYNAIVLARKEMALVKLLLLRHKNGEKADYCTEDSFDDVVAGAKLPSRYYREVTCCESCYKVYQLIENARTQSILKLTAKKRPLDCSPIKKVLAANVVLKAQVEAVPSATEGANSFQSALRAIEGLTKLDVAEIRTLSKPPAAVVVVLEAVTALLTGQIFSFPETRKLMGHGEKFLQMMKDFSLEEVDAPRLDLLEAYVDNPIFRPEFVADVSRCASKFCAWVLGVVQAVRWKRGQGHVRTDLLNKKVEEKGTSFVEKLGRKKVMRQLEPRRQVESSPTMVAQLVQSLPARPPIPQRLDDFIVPKDGAGMISLPVERRKLEKEKKASVVAQNKSSRRLASHNKVTSRATGINKEFLCPDGITTMSYTVLGEFSLDAECCSFIIVHDFFDTSDSTSILMKQITSCHPGCQILCFNYPGQAGTAWLGLDLISAPINLQMNLIFSNHRPHASQAHPEPSINAPPVFNNDFIADKLHELLLHTEKTGDFVLFSPFHIVGIGNGACIAAAFVAKYGATELCAGFLRSMVVVNGFLYPDAQLTSVLRSAIQVFESTPNNRPDIPVSFWSRYQFSDEYLSKINPKLALDIYTAVSNPITNEGRHKIATGCLHHRDIRGCLSPETKKSSAGAPVTIPIIVLQSTEDSLVGASNVDSFLVDRQAKHLWSHQLNAFTDSIIENVNDVNVLPWVGTLSKCPEMYVKASVLGKNGLRMLIDTLQNPKGVFVVWSRHGHLIQQESRPTLLDILDALANPSEERFGLPHVEPTVLTSKLKVDVPIALAPKLDVLFTIERPTRIVPPELLMEPSRSQLKAVLAPNHIVKQESADQTTIPIHAGELTTQTDFEESVLIAGGEKNDEEREASGTISLVHVGIIEEEQLSTDSAMEHNQIVSAETYNFTGTLLENDGKGLIGQQEFEASLVLGRQNQSSIATLDQRERKEWTDFVPSTESALALEAELRREETKFFVKEEAFSRSMDATTDVLVASLGHSQEDRLLHERYAQEDEALLQGLKSELEVRRRARNESEIQRRLQTQAVEAELIKSGLLEKYQPPLEGEAVMEMAPLVYGEPMDLPREISMKRDTLSQLDEMVVMEKEAKTMGVVYMEDFDRIKRKMAQHQIERDLRVRNLSEAELSALYNDCCVIMQRNWRGYLGRRRYNTLSIIREHDQIVGYGITQLQAHVRRRQAKKRVALVRFLHYENLRSGRSVLYIQSVWRGYLARGKARRIRRHLSAILIQKSIRGMIGRKAANKEKARLLYLLRKQRATLTIQSAWRMKVAKEEFRSVRIHSLAAIEIQRCLRGHIGRKVAKRRRDWESATPGPERIKLGLTLIEDTRLAFERQQEELDAIHRAQERAEARVSHIHADLKDSEKELLVLERELLEIDQIERDLINLTHERELISKGITNAAGLSSTAQSGDNSNGLHGKEYNRAHDPEAERRNKAEAFALEMTIQIKRAEREKKRQELETEFALVFQEVEKKKKALDRLEGSLADMEATRERKDREFRRLQSNLMQLLLVRFKVILHDNIGNEASIF